MTAAWFLIIAIVTAASLVSALWVKPWLIGRLRKRRWLNAMAEQFGLARKKRESDEQLRERILLTMQQPIHGTAAEVEACAMEHPNVRHAKAVRTKVPGVAAVVVSTPWLFPLNSATAATLRTHILERLPIEYDVVIGQDTGDGRVVWFGTAPELDAQ